MSELIYGRRAVLETLRAARRHLYRLWLEGDDLKGDGAKATGILREIVDRAAQANVPVRPVRGGIFERLAQQNDNAQGVALEVGDYPYVDLPAVLKRARAAEEPPLLLLLDHLQDPQNVGTLLRTAEAMGVHGVVLPDRRAARVTAAVSNASAGAVEHLLVAQETNLNRVIDELKERNVWVAGLDGGPDAPLLDPKTLRGALAVVVGSEGSGLSRLTREKCDFLARLPMHGQIESLARSAIADLAHRDRRPLPAPSRGWAALSLSLCPGRAAAYRRERATHSG
jgi:23S rRNA (guanosine2251-2'-O)-methyltransferase